MAWSRVWACLLAVALALSLTPGTAVAQQDTTPPSVVKVSTNSGANHDWIIFHFNENVVSLSWASWRVTYNGIDADIQAVSRATFGPEGQRTVGLQMVARIPAGAVVEVYYDPPTNPVGRLRDASFNYVRSIGWHLDTNRGTNRRILTNVYDALKAYFTGTGTLGEVNSVIRATENEIQTYHEALLEKTEQGQLHKQFGFGDNPGQGTPGDPTKWGTDEAAGWTQKGSPSHPGADPSLTCGGVGKPALTGADSSRFFWACTEDNRWVPVKLAQPGVDYARDEDLVRPTDVQNDPNNPNYNEMCRFKDADGNPTPVFRAHFHPDGRVMRYPDGHPKAGQVMGDEIHGHNWDPLAQQCTGRGGS